MIRSMRATFCAILTLALLGVALGLPNASQSPAAQPKATQPATPWWERAGEGNAGHYWIKTDVDPETARELATHLNRMYDAMAARIGQLPQRQEERLNVLIFKSRDDYLHTLNARYGVDARFTGGIFFVAGGESALAFWLEDLPKQRVLNVLQHEAFHQFAYSRFAGNLPIWVNEGLAEFFGEAVLVGRDLIIGQSKPRVIDAVKEAIEDETYLPFTDMIGVSSENWRDAMSKGSGQLQYNQAWSMVQFLVYGEDGRYQKAFERYLRLLNQGVDSEDAFMQAFQTNDVTAFEKRWKDYAAKATPSAFVTALERTEFLAEGLLELSRRGKAPKTLDEAKMMLREIEFTYTISNHGMATVLEATDDSLFTIPEDDLARQPPQFTLTPARTRRLSRREQLVEEKNPTPPAITTEHLRPRTIRVQWDRAPRTHELSYTIDLR